MTTTSAMATASSGSPATKDSAEATQSSSAKKWVSSPISRRHAGVGGAGGSRLSPN